MSEFSEDLFNDETVYIVPTCLDCEQEIEDEEVQDCPF